MCRAPEPLAGSPASIVPVAMRGHVCFPLGLGVQGRAGWAGVGGPPWTPLLPLPGSEWGPKGVPVLGDAVGSVTAPLAPPCLSFPSQAGAHVCMGRDRTRRVGVLFF